jgi:hypothetical protein
MSPIKHATRVSTREYKNLLNEPGGKILGLYGDRIQPVFNSKLLWTREPKLPLDAEANETEAVWGVRHADGKFPCKRGCTICEN